VDTDTGEVIEAVGFQGVSITANGQTVSFGRDEVAVLRDAADHLQTLEDDRQLQNEKHLLGISTKLEEMAATRDGREHLSAVKRIAPRFAPVIDAALAINHPVRIAGKGLHSILSACAERPERNEPPRPDQSVGIGERSIAAIRTSMAVVLGEAEHHYRPTLRPYAELAGDESKRLVKAVEWAAIPTLEPGPLPDGPVLPGMEDQAPKAPVFPPVHSVMWEDYQMIEIGRFRAADLEAIGKIVGALSGGTVDLYYAGDGRLGFKCDCPALDPGDGESVQGHSPVIPLKGVVQGKREALPFWEEAS
jgi:hypothetical protein